MKALFNSLTIKSRLLLILTVAILSLVVSQALSLNQLWHDLNTNKQQELKRITQVAYSIIIEQDELAVAGHQSVKQAKENAKTLISTLGYGVNEYFFIFDGEYKMVMHPVKPKLNGQNLQGMKDNGGKLFFQQMIGDAKSQGESFVDYLWTRPGREGYFDKKSYAKYHQGWGWGIATGVYTDDIVEQFQTELWTASKTTLAILAVMLFIVAQTSNSIIVPLLSLEHKMQQVAESKNLTIRSELSGKNELVDMGNAFNVMLNTFQKILHDMTLSSGQVASASTELSATTQQTLLGMEAQKSESHQVATAMNEMSTTVNDVAKNIAEAAQASHEASKASEVGISVIKTTKASVQGLGQKLTQAEELMKTLEHQSLNISSILSVITGIAEQTNLLALNAAIEAARAGEQGRGFAVVADEVRSLSSRTHESTSEINEVIHNLQEVSKAAVISMNESKVAADEVEHHTSGTEQALIEITTAVEQIDVMTSQIASASEQQAVVAEEINKNIVNISQISEESAVGSEQTAKASEELAHLAEDMSLIVSQFTLSETNTGQPSAKIIDNISLNNIAIAAQS